MPMSGRAWRTRSRGTGPVDLDDENYGSTTDEEFGADDFAISPLSSINGSGQPQQQHYYQQNQQLNHQQLQQFEMQLRDISYSISLAIEFNLPKSNLKF